MSKKTTIVSRTTKRGQTITVSGPGANNLFAMMVAGAETDPAEIRHALAEIDPDTTAPLQIARRSALTARLKELEAQDGGK